MRETTRYERWHVVPTIGWVALGDLDAVLQDGGAVRATKGVHLNALDVAQEEEVPDKNRDGKREV